jgi:hypothetical protein
MDTYTLPLVAAGILLGSLTRSWAIPAFLLAFSFLWPVAHSIPGLARVGAFPIPKACCGSILAP